MSNVQRLENVKQVVLAAEPDFSALARIHNAVNFARESSFALQILKDNDFLAGVAMSDQDSLKRAIINVAAIGLTLSPVHKLAYLVPRKKKVCLDISYRGLVQLAIDVGAVKWVMAEVVRERDEFVLNDFGKAPSHRFQPFGDRGLVVGAYCVAKTHDGEYLTTVMSGEEILAIRDRSESWKSYEKDSSKSTPWITDEGEMIKKTVIKRASKMWPMTDTRPGARERFDQAIDVSNSADPVDFSAPPQIEGSVDKRAEGLAKIRELLGTLGRTEEKFIEHQTRACKRTIKSLEDLTEIEVSQAVAFLTGMLPKPKTDEAPVENAG